MCCESSFCDIICFLYDIVLTSMLLKMMDGLFNDSSAYKIEKDLIK